MPTLYICCGCILLNTEKNIENHSYLKLLAVKAAIVEEVKTVPQNLSTVALHLIVELAIKIERYADTGWKSDFNY